jgi:hypothetical protein
MTQYRNLFNNSSSRDSGVINDVRRGKNTGPWLHELYSISVSLNINNFVEVLVK